MSSPAFDTKSRFASAVLSGTNIVDGELAVEEQPVSSLPQFRLVAKLGKARADRQGIQFWFDDGTDATDLLRVAIPKRADGTLELPLWGGLIRLEPVAGGRYRIHPVEPLKDQLSAAAVLSGGRRFDHASNVQVVRY